MNARILHVSATPVRGRERAAAVTGVHRYVPTRRGGSPATSPLCCEEKRDKSRPPRRRRRFTMSFSGALVRYAYRERGVRTDNDGRDLTLQHR